MPSTSAPVAGFWPAALSAAQAACAMADFVELRAVGQGVVWSCHEPATGLTQLWQGSANQPPRRLTPEGFSVRSRVNEYGGGSFAVAGSLLVFVNERDQQLYRQRLDRPDERPVALTSRPACRYADMQIAPCGRYLVAVEEEHDTAGVQQCIVRIGTEQPHERQALFAGADFYSSPRISANGRRLLWVSWQRPHQSWTQTQLYGSTLTEKDHWTQPQLLAGGQGDASIQQPVFDAQHRIVALNDQQGFWQPWREQDGRLQPLPGIGTDHAGAPWQMGGCNFLPVDERFYLLSGFEQGFGWLGLYDLDNASLAQSWLPDYSRMRHLAVDAEYFYCIASHPARGPAVLAIHRVSGAVSVLAQLETGLGAEQVSRPQALEFATSEGQQAQAFFYPPHNPDYQLQENERPPLVIFLHGGPTSAAYPVFDPRIQFWTQRGFAVADLNYRGSTGFGRAYRHMLAGRWGELEVADVLALADTLVAQGRAHPQQLFVRGASAGGYSSLLAVAASRRFAAAASWYGVSDPLALDKVTHKFEGDYLGWLLGPLSGANLAAVRRRSPLALAGQIRSPVIFFQGGQDVVVVPEQTRSMVRQLQALGVEVECHEFPEQGHGFRCAERLAFALEAELAFYRRQLAVILRAPPSSCAHLPSSCAKSQDPPEHYTATPPPRNR